MKSVNASSGRDTANVVPDPIERDFGTIEGLQINASTTKNSNTHSNRIAETRGNITVEVCDLSIHERNSDRQKHTPHTMQILLSTDPKKIAVHKSIRTQSH